MRLAIHTANGLAAALLGIVIVGAVFLAIKDHRDWNEYMVAHDCRVVAKSAAQSVWHSDGTTSTIPATTTYRCNDGVEYVR